MSCCIRPDTLASLEPVDSDLMRYVFDIELAEYIERKGSSPYVYYRSALRLLVSDLAWVAEPDTNPSSNYYGKIELNSKAILNWEYFMFDWDTE